MIYRKGICSLCRREVVIVKRLPSGHLCRACNDKRLTDKAEGREREGIATKRPQRKPSGQLSLFRAIWASRPHVSFISGKPIKNPTPINFFHIMGKQAYPKFKLYDRNIILTTRREHELWHQDRGRLRDLPEWKKVFDLYERLKAEYHGVA